MSVRQLQNCTELQINRTFRTFVFSMKKLCLRCSMRLSARSAVTYCEISGNYSDALTALRSLAGGTP